MLVNARVNRTGNTNDIYSKIPPVSSTSEQYPDYWVLAWIAFCCKPIGARNAAHSRNAECDGQTMVGGSACFVRPTTCALRPRPILGQLP